LRFGRDRRLESLMDLVDECHRETNLNRSNAQTNGVSDQSQSSCCETFKRTNDASRHADAEPCSLERARRASTTQGLFIAACPPRVLCEKPSGEGASV